MDINQLLRDEIEAAKKLLPVERPTVAGSSYFNPYVLIFCPRGILQYYFGHETGEDKARKKVIMTGMAKLLDAYLAVVVMDTSLAKVEPDRYPWNKMYQEAKGDPERMLAIHNQWLQKHYGGSIHNLPEHLRTDCLLAGGKGPEIPPFAMAQPYHYTDTGIVYDKLKPCDETAYLNTIGDWWKMQINQDVPHEVTEMLRTLVIEAIPQTLGHWRELNKVGAESWMN